MTPATLETVWNDIATLTSEDKIALRQRLEKEVEDAAKLAEVFRLLREKGMLTTELLPRHPSDPPVKPWVIEGEPLSETIIRGRG